MRSDPALFEKLAAFQIDSGSPRLTFVQRLARENAWSVEFAHRVTREYFRFVYLACVSKSQVTPSIAVDQAWHLHLSYTRSYWISLSQQLLGRPLHHGPTEGGPQEDARYRAQYEHTLRIYEAEFGETPPSDVWPPPERRFSRDANPFWVARDRFIVVERARITRAAGLIGIALLGLLGTGAGASKSHAGPLLVLVVVAITIGLLIWWSSRHGKGGRGSGGGGCGTGGGGCGSSGGGGDSGCGGGCGGD